MSTERISDYPVESLFLDRWSPRAFTATSMPSADLFTIIEAARWAPSAYNIQPWRFLYSHRDDANWQIFLDLLDEFNASWAQHASVLMIVLSDTVMPGDGTRPDKPSRCHSFDAGASWAQLALQATQLGYRAHAMVGVDFGRARKWLNIPQRFHIEIAIAIGKQDDPSILPMDLRVGEKPSGRLSVHEISYAGSFPE